MATPDVDGEILLALYGHVETWQKPAGMTVVYPLQKFDPKGRDYVRIANLPNIKRRITINNGGIHDLPGILQASFVYQIPRTDGLTEQGMLKQMGTLVTHFKSGTALTIASGGKILISSQPSIGGQQIAADRVQMSVSINWRIFD